MERFRLSDKFIEQYPDKKPPFGFNGLGEITFFRTYSRIKPDGSNEQWWETCKRVVEGTYNMQKRHIEEQGLGWNAYRGQKSAQEMFDRMFSMKFLPPGRGLWAMGSPITEERKLYAALNNCAFVSTANLKEDIAKPFAFLMDASMLGVGVGFDTSGAGQIIVEGPNKKRNVEVFLIPDTREGWVDSVKLLLETYFLGISDVEFDYSAIRSEGQPIKGFGGVSAGYKPLENLHKSIRKTLDKEVGQPISITSIVDLMNHIGVAVVAGNVRRTAEIVFGDSKSNEYLKLKDYEWNKEKQEYTGSAKHRADYGWTSNNSIFATLGMDYTAVAEQTAHNGEPGYAWLENIRGYSRMNNGPDNKDHRAAGANPCIIGSTNIAVADGRNAVPIKDLVGTQYPVYSIENGKVVIKQSIKTWKTKENAEVWKLSLDDGSELIATPDHQIMLRNGEYLELKDLKVGMSLMPFNSYISRGFRTPYRQISSNTGRDRRQYRMIAEYNDIIVDAKSTAIHHQDFDSFNDRIENLQALSHEEHHKLHDISGTANPVFKMTPESRSEWKRKLSLASSGSGNPMFGRQRTKQWIKVTCPVCNDEMTVTEYKSRGFETCSHSCQNRYRSKSFQASLNHKVISTEFYGYEDVYDMTVENTHNFGVISSHQDDRFIESSGIFISNCVEQSLESYELCCLVETFPYNHDSIEDYLRTLKFAYLYAKTVTLGKTHWPETNRVMLRNRRIGCSMSGIAQFIEKQGIQTLKEWCEKGYEEIQKWDEMYSEWLATPRSIKTTSVKPSGTVSLLAGATPGLHYPQSRFYIRRLRLSQNSALIKPLRAAGYYVEPAVKEENTMIVEIPVDVGAGIKTLKEVSMWEQFSLAAFMQRHWADNQVSATITFDPVLEGKQIAAALTFFQYQLKGVSLLPNTEEGSYAQMPYEEIDEKTYKEKVKNLKRIKFDAIKGEEAEVDKFCNNDVCEIPT